jgi:hypothetical protein
MAVCDQHMHRTPMGGWSISNYMSRYKSHNVQSIRIQAWQLQLVPTPVGLDRRAPLCLGTGSGTSAAVQYMCLLQQYLWRAQPLVQG